MTVKFGKARPNTKISNKRWWRTPIPEITGLKLSVGCYADRYDYDIGSQCPSLPNNFSEANFRTKLDFVERFYSVKQKVNFYEISRFI